MACGSIVEVMAFLCYCVIIKECGDEIIIEDENTITVTNDQYDTVNDWSPTPSKRLDTVSYFEQVIDLEMHYIAINQNCS